MNNVLKVMVFITISLTLTGCIQNKEDKYYNCWKTCKDEYLCGNSAIGNEDSDCSKVPGFIECKNICLEKYKL